VRWEVVVVASVLALASGCRKPSPDGVPSGLASSTPVTPGVITSQGQGHEALRDDARLILERHCGQCHIREYPTALPGALAVYDLREPNWSARMTDAQLRNALWRLDEPLPPDGRPSDVSPDERARFAAYVDAELARHALLDGGSGR
jgi:hypothetical protein